MATKLRKRTNLSRKLLTEALEPRAMMAADAMHNFLFPHDVDDDGSVTPLDALVVINHLNRGADDSSSTERQFHDVDDDSQVTPLDALILINDLNSKTVAQSGNSPIISQSSVLSNPVSGTRVRVEMETEGTESELNIRIDNAPISSSFAVSLNDIALGQLTTDAKGRGQIVLGHGEDNREHLPIPVGLSTLSPEMELVIGDIVKGKLSQVAKVESNGSGTAAPLVVESQEQHFATKFDVVGGVRRSAEFEQESEHGVSQRKFEAEIEKATPNSNFEVSVGGVLVGSIATDSKGKGKLRLTSNPKDASDKLMPASFPVVAEGMTVKIGTVESTLQKVLRDR